MNATKRSWSFAKYFFGVALIVGIFVGVAVSLMHPEEVVGQSVVTTAPNFKVAFIGDSGYGSGFQNILNLIKGEGAHLVLHQGDFSYSSGPTGAWTDMINSTLGSSFPYLGSDGNHDTWSQYTPFFKDRLSQMGLDPNDLNGEDYSTAYQGLKMVFIGEQGNPGFVEQQLAGDPHAWKICSWHKDQRAMQVGGKGDEMGWPVYEKCRELGAIIATAHEHSYARTKTLISTEQQTVDPTCSERDVACVAPGKTFVFHSGLGGGEYSKPRPMSTHRLPLWL